MRKRLLATAGLAIALAVGACQPGAMSPVQPGAKNPPASTINAAMLTGQVLAPAGIIAPGGGNIIAPGGGNIISTGGGNYKVLAEETLEEAPLAGAEVYLADAAGSPLPGFKSVKTDAQGRYTLPEVKAGYTFVVVAKAKGADGKTVEFQTIVKATELGATADVDAATTLVAASLVDSQEGALGNFNAAKFKTAAQATKRSLKRDQLPDFSNRAEVLAKIRALSEEVAEIRSALDEIKQELNAIKSQLADLQNKLDSVLEDRSSGGGVGDCGMFFEHLDADGNGRVTLAEWMDRFEIETGDQDNPRDIFIFVDRNADGQLTSEEFMPECEKHQSQDGEQGEGSCEDGFRFMDQDRSGSLDLEEFKRGHRPPPGETPPPAEEIFGHMDMNRDGQVSQTEFIEACERRDQPPPDQDGPPTVEDCERNFTFTDRNRDGIVDAEEFKLNFRPRPGETTTAEQAFRFIDRNADARIERQEFVEICSGTRPPAGEPTCQDRFRHHDGNADGKVDLAELKATYRVDPGSPPPEEVFRHLDQNADGFITEREFVAVQCEGQTNQTTQPGPSDCEEEFGRLDANRDRLVGPKELELVGWSAGDAQAHIAERDRNGDSRLDPAEFCGP